MSIPEKQLFILCGNFPFGFGEPFLEVEMTYLKRHFEQITIMTTSRREAKAQFEVPIGVSLTTLDVEPSRLRKMISVFRLLFDPAIRSELRTVVKDYHGALGWGKLKTMLVSRLRSLRIAAQVKVLLPSNGEQRLFVYSYWSDDCAVAAAYLKRARPEITAFCRAHGWDLYFERSVYHYLPFRKTIFNGLDAVFTISENGRNYLLSHFASIIGQGRIYQSRLGIRTVERPLAYERRFRRFKLVSCSNLIPIKRVQLIVDALSNIEDLEIEWTHFGNGPEMASILTMCQERLGQKQNIEYHFPGRIPNWKVLQYYSDHMVDLFISLSRYDGIPVSIMEAMSFGVPAIATDVGGVSEIVIDGGTGFLLDAESTPAVVADLISSIAAMEDRDYEVMRMEAKQMWGTFYSADINYPDFCEQVLALGQVKV